MDNTPLYLGIKIFREEKRITQEQLAEKTNVTRQAISNWETEKTEPDIDTLHKIAQNLNISIEELIHGEKHMKNHWSFLREYNICSLRCAGVLFKDDKLLVQKERDGNKYALPGGLVKIGETTEQALIRRYREETGADIICDRLIWVDESFWEWNNRKAHTITFYYLISLKDASSILDNGKFMPQKDNINVIYGWMPIENIYNLTIYPAFIKEKINNISDGIEHFIYKE